MIDTKIALKVHTKRLLADTVTPVTLYMNLRDRYSDPVLLESNDSHSDENALSLIGLETIAAFSVQNGQIQARFPDGQVQKDQVATVDDVPNALRAFLDHFEPSYEQESIPFNGLFGHTCFDGVQYFDSHTFEPEKRYFDLPDLRYHLYRFIILIDHFKDEMTLIENCLPGEESRLNELESLVLNRKFLAHPFKRQGEETSNLTDQEFMDMVRAGKHHCRIGDVFQIVLSRRFEQQFLGDDFQVYRVLRHINPSPYLFYFDYGDYRIFGSSPEAQMVIRDQKARVNPIAGTYKRTGDFEADLAAAKALSQDPKENAEHIMLVDLARNDLGRHTTNVQVSKLKEIQFFSHVIHLVSTVEGDIGPDGNPVRIFGDTFPAGTLSGAPKYKAIELISKYEKQNRGIYGGGLGFIDFAGNMNQAIVIRSFLSKQNTLYYQAGAGIVDASVEENELKEVNNKLGALKRALEMAEKI